MDDCVTYKDLYEYLVKYSDTIIHWLSTDVWHGKDKQEAILRLFSGLRLIQKLDSFNICKGNFNKRTIKCVKSYKEIFYDRNNNLIKLKDKGDSSDLTGISKHDNKNILVTTSKNLKKMTLNDLDIGNIVVNFKQYENLGYTMTLCICIKTVDKFNKMIRNSDHSSKELIKLATDPNTILIDWYDLEQAFYTFKTIFKDVTFDNLVKITKHPAIFKLHQTYTIAKTCKLRSKGIKNVLWGHIQRSGKSYIICGAIIQDSLDKQVCNYLIITTAPNETIDQQRSVLDCMQLQDFNIAVLNGENKNPKLGSKNVILCSKQYLQSKLKSCIKWLNNMQFDARFIDESHNGGTTELSHKILNMYGNDAFTVFITATYDKPANVYNVPLKCRILWDSEDINLCKNIDKDSSIDLLCAKHGKLFANILSTYSLDNVKKEYSKYPELHILTRTIDTNILKEISANTKDNFYGWSTDACLLVKETVDEKGHKIVLPEFQNEVETTKLLYSIFGKYDKYGIPDKFYPDHQVMIKRVENICRNPLVQSRFGNCDEPAVIMIFLPPRHINEISVATVNLMKKCNIMPDYNMLIINSFVTNNPKQLIDDAVHLAKQSGKKGVIVLSGNQCSLGVSIDNCDIVILLTNSASFDSINQKMFRCMTESINKKCGFVIDMNVDRVVKCIIESADIIKTKSTLRSKVKYILMSRLINLNIDHWNISFAMQNSSNVQVIDDICGVIDSVYKLDVAYNCNRAMNMIKTLSFNLKQSDTDELKTLFGRYTKNKTERLKKGIESRQLNFDAENESKSVETKSNSNVVKVKEEDRFKEYLYYFMRLICLLTIHDNNVDFIEMYRTVNSSNELRHILLNQVKIWWTDDTDEDSIDSFMEIYDTVSNTCNNFHIFTQSTKAIKESFIANRMNSKSLSKVIDEILIPHKSEKLQNAEVSTPYVLRQDMLNLLPIKFWQTPKKIFEPCAGKGGFILDIIDKFMEHLTGYSSDEEKYRIVVEQCLYFSDINPTNIFICKLLIDPTGKYALNYNEGDTLKIELKDQFAIESFDAVIGNPPYNHSGNVGTGNTIWQHFTKMALENWLTNDGYLLFVHPPGWRKPNTEKSKFYGLFDLMCKQNYMEHLVIRGLKDGQDVFNCGTRFDYYLIKKTKNNDALSVINDEEHKTFQLNMNEWEWLPNCRINLVKNILSMDKSDRCNIIYSRTNYGSDKAWVSKDQTDEYKYPCVHATPKSGVRTLYSSTNERGFFNIPKVIFGKTGTYNAVLDVAGEYGITEHAMGIVVDSEEIGKKVIDAVRSELFMQVLDCCSFSLFSIEWRLFLHFKKDFWKAFV